VAVVECSGSGEDPAPGAGRLVAGSKESPELAIWLPLRFPETLSDELWEAVDVPPTVVLRLPAGTVGLFFFPLTTAFLNSFRRAGVSWTQDIALRKASSSSFSMTLLSVNCLLSRYVAAVRRLSHRTTPAESIAIRISTLSDSSESLSVSMQLTATPNAE
jgi:hypothetical protein